MKINYLNIQVNIKKKSKKTIKHTKKLKPFNNAKK